MHPCRENLRAGKILTNYKTVFDTDQCNQFALGMQSARFSRRGRKADPVGRIPSFGDGIKFCHRIGRCKTVVLFGTDLLAYIDNEKGGIKTALLHTVEVNLASAVPGSCSLQQR